MGTARSAEQVALVRASAAAIVDGGGPAGADREYLSMARGTLAGLDWLEHRTDLAPSTGEHRRPEDVVEGGAHYRPTALHHEINWSEDWGSGRVQPPTEDAHFHGAVWSLLTWWRSSDPHRELAILVPGVTG